VKVTYAVLQGLTLHPKKRGLLSMNFWRAVARSAWLLGVMTVAVFLEAQARAHHGQAWHKL
jgi:hypothetical protein